MAPTVYAVDVAIKLTEWERNEMKRFSLQWLPLVKVMSNKVILKYCCAA